MIRSRSSTFKNEAALIEAVKNNPIIYNKNTADYRKPAKTDNAWSDIGKELNCPVVNCKKRWKSLRDTFIKYYRMEIQANTSSSGGKRKVNKFWMFYEDLSFLKGHVELFGLTEPEQDETFESKCDIVKAKEENTYEIAYPTEYDNMDVEDLAEIEEVDDERNEYVVESISAQTSSQGEQYIIQQHIKEHEYEIRRREPTEKEFDLMPFDEPSSSFKTEPDSKVASVILSSADSDERFLLSCAPALKRLNARQNAYVRMSIQHLLFEVEFNNEEQPINKPKL